MHFPNSCSWNIKFCHTCRFTAMRVVPIKLAIDLAIAIHGTHVPKLAQLVHQQLQNRPHTSASLQSVTTVKSDSSNLKRRVIQLFSVLVSLKAIQH